MPTDKTNRREVQKNQKNQIERKPISKIQQTGLTKYWWTQDQLSQETEQSSVSAEDQRPESTSPEREQGQVETQGLKPKTTPFSGEGPSDLSERLARISASMDNEKEIIREEYKNLDSQETIRYKIIGWNKDDNKIHGGLPKFYEMEEAGDYLEHKDGHKAFIPFYKKGAIDDFYEIVKEFAPISKKSAKIVKNSKVQSNGWEKAKRGNLGHNIKPAPVHIENSKAKISSIAEYTQKAGDIIKDINTGIYDINHKIKKKDISKLRTRSVIKTLQGWERSDFPVQEIGRCVVWKAIKDKDDI